jgi:predicted ribonuclease YlaK
MIERIIETGEIPEELGKICENQYVLFKDLSMPFKNKHGETDYAIYDSFVCRGDTLHHLPEKHAVRIKNEWCTNPEKGIGPRNPEQECLFDILNNRGITIVYAGGKFGTGKSFILNNFALQEIEKGRIKKIVYVPNNAYTENTIDVGALPGELLDKVAGQIGPLVDLVGIDKIQDMISHG